MHAQPPSPFLRLARSLRPGGNPLARGVDRAEAAVVVVVVLLALVLVPVLLTLGSVIHGGLVEQGRREAATRHETVAVLTADAPVTVAGTPGMVVSAKVKVAARWELADGTTRTGRVEADEGLHAGAQVRIWVDDTGTPTAAPLSTQDATAMGVLVAVMGWLAATGVLAVIWWLLHRVFDRRRYRAWDEEWARLGPGQLR